MKIVQKSEQQSIDMVAESLKNGNICVLPTDTVYGISGIVDEKGFFQYGTRQKIAKLKGREEKKPFIHLISKPEDISKYAKQKIPRAVLELWPGALSIVIEVKKGVFPGYEQDTVAFRCPDDPWLCCVIEKCGHPIYSTSANIANCRVCETALQAAQVFKDKVDIVVDAGNKKGSVPSTIIKIEEDKISLLRQGAVVIPL